MWILLVVLVGLPAPGSGMPLDMLHLLAPSKNDSGPEPQSPSTSPAPPVAPTTLSPRSEAPALSLNLGLNFKIKVRSQGKGPGSEGARGATADPGLPSAPSQAPGSRFWAEAQGGSGWLGPGPVEELPSGPGGWAWEGSLVPAEAPFPASSPAPQLPLAFWPMLTKKGGAAPVAGQEDSRELEFKIDIDLTAGVGKEGGLAPNGSSPGRHLPLLPGLRVGIAEIASKLRGESPGLFGSRVPPVTWEPPDWNATRSTWELPGDSSLTPERALQPGAESSGPPASPDASPVLAALPGCTPEDGGQEEEEECGAPGPWRLAAPGLAVGVPLAGGWRGARAAWGAAWAAHVYGAGALFALQAALALGGLGALACRRAAGGLLVAPLQLLLAGAGAARALPLLLLPPGEACGRAGPGPWPAPAVRLLQELPLPCLTSALALGCLLLLRARRGPAPRRPPVPPALLLLLLLLLGLHLAAAAGAPLAAGRLPQAPLLLLAARGLFALLAALLSAALLALSCPPRAAATPPPGTACPTQGPFADGHRAAAAAAALLAALFGLLSAALHAYAVAHALGYGLRDELFGPWPWWALQLAGRLGEAGVGLPLAALGLCALAGGVPACPCLPAKAQGLPRSSIPWALAQPGGKPDPDPVRRPADYLPLCALPPTAPAPTAPDDDPTADFRPPSPIDLRRSIDEALSQAGGHGPGPLAAASTLSLRPARPPSPDSPLFRTASCVELRAARASPQPWTASPGQRSPDDGDATSVSSSSAALVPGPTAGGSGLLGARSPPPPARQAWPLPPASQESLASLGRARGAEAALLQDEFLDVCRQIDALSVSSDTIDL